MEPVTSGAPDQPPHRRRLGVALGVAIVVLIAPAIALASHQFGDVPTSASYHDEVESLVNAGITSGCGGGNYCPNQAVTRGQMAQFMTRGLGIATAGYGELPRVPGTMTSMWQRSRSTLADSRARPASSRSTRTSTCSTSTAFCPCGIIFSIEETTTLEPGPTGTMGTSRDVVGGRQPQHSGSINWVFEVPTG